MSFFPTRKRVFIPLALGLMLALAVPALAVPALAAQGPAVLLVTFGSSHEGAMAPLKEVEQAVKAAHPKATVAWAYTSGKVRAILAKKGRPVASPSEALAQLHAQGARRVAVQSLHVIPGAEFHDLAAQVKDFAAQHPGFKAAVGWPLMSGDGDVRALAKAILAGPPAQRQANEAVVLVGHGSHHPAGVAYGALAHALNLGDRLVFLGTVEGWPGLDEVLDGLNASKVRKVYLMPLLTVLGEHSKQDIAGTDKDSWASRLTAAGLAVEPVLRAVTQTPGVKEIWLGHLQKALDELGK